MFQTKHILLGKINNVYNMLLCTQYVAHRLFYYYYWLSQKLTKLCLSNTAEMRHASFEFWEDWMYFTSPLN